MFRRRRRVKPPAYIPEQGPTAGSPFGCPAIVSGYPFPPEEVAALQSMLAEQARRVEVLAAGDVLSGDA